MSRIVKIINAKPPNAYQGMLEVDMDANAERLIVLNRFSGELIHNVVRSITGIVQLRVPVPYSSNATLLVGIVDDDGAFNCKFVDGVQAQIVDGNLLTMKR